MHVARRTLAIGRLFDTVRDGVVVADETGRIMLWNPAAAQIFGYTSEEALDLNVDALVPERLRADHHRGIARYERTGHGPFIDANTVLVLPALKKGGEEILVELTLSPLEDEEADGRYALAIVRNVTERVRLEASLERERERLSAANQALTTANLALESFSYVVSHDLKEPVRAIEAFLGALEEDHASDLDPEARALVSRARRASVRLQGLLRGLLDLSRTLRDETPFGSVSIGDVLSSGVCRAQFERLLEERGGALAWDDGIPPVRASAPLLCQVLGNLVANAIKHNDAPGPRVRVRGPLPASAGRVRIAVEDNGPGFPVVFRRAWNEGNGATATTGGGFGLLIARRAVERLGGSISIGEAAGGGGSVQVELPAA